MNYKTVTPQRGNDVLSAPLCKGYIFISISIVVNCCIAVKEGSDDVLRDPCSFPCDFVGDSENGGVLVLRAYTDEVFRCKATVDVLTKVFCSEVVSLQLIYMIYCFV